MKNTGMNISRSACVIVSIFLLAGVVGCKTDALLGQARVDETAPITSLTAPSGVDLPSIPVTDRTEVDLVEKMMLHRAMYGRYLEVLETFYREHGYEYKAIWARNEMNDLARVKPYRYILDVEVPVATLRPSESVAGADQLFEEGKKLMRKGGHGVPIFFHEETMKLALAKFKELVNRYPTSDKIDDAAFYIAEIHKEYTEEKDNLIALRWYQRAVDWNPDLPYPARFQMAVIYHHRLKDREKALELYQEVIDKEQFNKSNVIWARAEIRKLTSEKTRHASGEPVEELQPEPEETQPPAGESVEASPAPPAKVP